ncbi:Protein FAM63A [Hypsibius exemplaris]|uniref:Protein FAM63A n=1 Tax=Hypsibius exemplaris TaxID=2072580 RepID=A0A1W0WXP9_HYPEX|nr:Protein FAM63A [Hypsibius exemplaris]
MEDRAGISSSPPPFAASHAFCDSQVTKVEYLTAVRTGGDPVEHRVFDIKIEMEEEEEEEVENVENAKNVKDVSHEVPKTARTPCPGGNPYTSTTNLEGADNSDGENRCVRDISANTSRELMLSSTEGKIFSAPQQSTRIPVAAAFVDVRPTDFDREYDSTQDNVRLNDSSEMIWSKLEESSPEGKISTTHQQSARTSSPTTFTHMGSTISDSGEKFKQEITGLDGCSGKTSWEIDESSTGGKMSTASLEAPSIPVPPAFRDTPPINSINSRTSDSAALTKSEERLSESAGLVSESKSWKDMRDHCMNFPSEFLERSSATTAGADQSPEASIYQIKWISFRGSSVPVVTQNHNGPCPLIALVNVLLLTKRMTLQNSIEYQSGENLLSQIAMMILESVPEKATEDIVRNYEQNVQDAMAILSKLQTGIDINVKFVGPRQYEFTQETLLFDLLRVPLVHGWIPDANDPSREVVEKHGSYNGIVEFVINGKTSEETIESALLAEDWLERTQSQLTYAGLVALSDCLTSDDPCVLFRNNHFSTIVKHDGQIFVLVTDEGYATERSCVWEQMSNIEGDTDFCDDRFCRRVLCKAPMTPPKDVLMTAAEQEELDRALALSLMQVQDSALKLSVEMERQEVKDAGWEAMELSDYEIARALQTANSQPHIHSESRLADGGPDHHYRNSLQAWDAQSHLPSDARFQNGHPLPPRPNFGRGTGLPNVVASSQSAYQLKSSPPTEAVSCTTRTALHREALPNPYERPFESDYAISSRQQQEDLPISTNPVSQSPRPRLSPPSGSTKKADKPLCQLFLRRCKLLLLVYSPAQEKVSLQKKQHERPADWQACEADLQCTHFVVIPNNGGRVLFHGERWSAKEMVCDIDYAACGMVA